MSTPNTIGRLRVLCMTYNVGTEEPSQEFQQHRRFSQFISSTPLDGPEEVVDLCALAFQEVSSRPDRYLMDSLRGGRDPWTRWSDVVLGEKGLKRVRRVRLLGAVLCVYVRRRHLAHLREVEAAHLRLSGAGLKATVCARMRMYGVSLCFVNSHLTAHDWNLRQRVEEYGRCLEEIHFKSRNTSRILYHDYIIWLGDLNFRLEENSFTFQEIVQRVREGSLEDLLEKDQLDGVRRTGEAFSELSESAVTFPPSFKFVVGCDEFDPKRRPGWPDRVLHRCNAYNYEAMDFTLELQPKLYERCDYRVSDHRPVRCVLDLTHFTRRHPAARGVVDRFGPIVRFESPRKRSEEEDDDEEDACRCWWVGSDAHVVYSVVPGEMGGTTAWDWIGLFKSDFVSLDEWLAFNYTSPCRRTGIPKTVTFPGSSVFLPGNFVLIYFGSDDSVLGISDEFEIRYPPPVMPPLEMAEEAAEALLDSQEQQDQRSQLVLF